MQRNAPRRQHYVPQWYLRRFRDPTSKAGRDYVAAYDQRSKTQHERMAIKNVAVESNFYTLEAPDHPDAYIVEKQLARLDELHSDLIARILDRGSVLNAEIPEVRALLVLQHARTRALRQRTERAFRGEVQRQVGEQLEEEGPPANWPDELRESFAENIEVLKRCEWKAENEKDELMAIQLGPNRGFRIGLDLFRGFTIVRLLNAAFVASDNPIVARRLSYPHWGGIMDIGLANASELWFPLDPRHALLMTRDAVACPTLIDLPVPQIRDINNALMRASDRWTIWQPGSAADQFLDLPVARKVISQRRSARNRTSPDSASPSEN